MTPGGRLFLLAAAIAVSSPALAAGDAAAGRRTVDTWCGGCHQIADDDKKAGLIDAPPFSDVARQRAPEAIRAFLAKPHPPRPQFRLTPKDIDDLAAFIGSLKK